MQFSICSTHFKHYKTFVQHLQVISFVSTHIKRSTLYDCFIKIDSSNNLAPLLQGQRVVYEFLPSVVQRVMCHCLCLCEQHSCTTVMCDIVVGTLFNLCTWETVIRKVKVSSFHYPAVIKKSHVSYIIQQ